MKMPVIPNSKSSDEYLMKLNSSTSSKNNKGENIGSFLNKMTTGNETGEPTTTKVKNNDEITKEDFMNLLVAELQNQNPLEPMDNKEFGSHLAQFSQLEQMEEMNRHLSKMNNSNEPVTKMFSASLIGKSITTESVDIKHEKGKIEELSFNLPDKAANVEIKVYDDTKNLVKTIDAGSREAGLTYVKWNGKAKDGRYLPDGKYTFEVSAANEHGSKIKVERGVSGKVVSVDYSGNDVSLVLESGNKIKMSEIKHIGESPVVSAKKAADTYQNIADNSQTDAAVKNQIQQKVLDQAMEDKKHAGEKI